MRVGSYALLLPALLGALSMDTAADAQNSRPFVCLASTSVVSGRGTRYISGPVIMPPNPSNDLLRQLERDFRALIPSDVYGSCRQLRDFSYEQYFEQVNAPADYGRRPEMIRVNLAGDYVAQAATRPAVPARAPRAPGVYIMPPTAPGTQPVESVQESEESRRAVAARYRQQQEQVRSIAESNARQAAAHRARLAESERQNAAHRAAMAENARQQEAHRRARAEWEARVAACRAGNRDACGHRVTPQ